MEQWALITGASTGIGRELAEVFAHHGVNLVLVARTHERLVVAAEELRSVHKIQTRVLPADLSLPDAPAKVFEAISSLPISILVNNAGFGTYGAFAQTELATQTKM